LILPTLQTFHLNGVGDIESSTKTVGNGCSPHYRTFGEVSKHLGAEMSKILIIGPKFIIGGGTSISLLLSKNINFAIFFSLIINYSVSYNVDKAYKVILGLIFGSA